MKEKWSRLFAAKRYNTKDGVIKLTPIEQQEILDDIKQELQQEREKWKEEVFRALSRGAYLAITRVDVVNTGVEPYFEEYYETKVKPRIESK